MQFVDRTEAGKLLTEKLIKYRDDAVVYALPRGGVAVAAEVAIELEVPMDLILVRKIGHQGVEEFALCAVTEHGDPACEEADLSFADPEWLEVSLKAARAENARRRKLYFNDTYQRPSVEGATAIIVDDGIATGLTMQAAIAAVREYKPREIVLAVPVAPHDIVRKLRDEVDEIITVDNPKNFSGVVGSHYDHFPQLTDNEVIDLIAEVHDVVG